MKTQQLAMVVDLNERGSFQAHVEDEKGKTVFSFSNEDEETGWPSEDGLWLVTDGFMDHCLDVDGLHQYMLETGFAKPGSCIRMEGGVR